MSKVIPVMIVKKSLSGREGISGFIFIEAPADFTDQDAKKWLQRRAVKYIKENEANMEPECSGNGSSIVAEAIKATMPPGTEIMQGFTFKIRK